MLNYRRLYGEALATIVSGAPDSAADGSPVTVFAPQRLDVMILDETP